MKCMLVLNRHEVQTMIPYAVICEARDGSRWDTGRRRRRYETEFTKKERERATDIFATARRWYLQTGVPETVRMMPETFTLWLKLGDFCASL